MRINIAKISMIVAGILLFSKFIAFVRDPLLASLFGVSVETDSFFLAFIIATFIFTLTSQALSAGFIPLYIKRRQKFGLSDALGFASSIFSFLVILLTVATGLIWVFAEPIVSLIFQGLDGEAIEQTVNLVRIMAPVGLLMPSYFLLSLLLNAERKFILPPLAILVGNLVVVSIILLFSSTLGVEAFGIGVLLGVVTQFLLVYAVIWKLKLNIALRIPNRQHVKSFGVISLPAVAAAVIFNLHFLIIAKLSSGQGVGTYSYLSFALRLDQVILDLVIASFVTVIFPYFSYQTAVLDFNKLKEYLEFGLKSVSLILAPISALIIIFRDQIIEIIYQRNVFTASDTEATSLALALFSLSLLAFGLSEILNRVFYSMRDTLTPLAITGFAFIVSVVLYLKLGSQFGGMGLALVYSISAFITLVLSWVFLFKKLQIKTKNFVSFALKLVLATAALSASAFALLSFFDNLETGAFTKTIFTLVSSGLGLLVFVIVGTLLGISEFQSIYKLVREKIRGET